MSEDEQDRSDLRHWIDEEAMNFEKMLSGERRLDFLEWKQRRDEKARTVRGSEA